jgi:anti-sigma regulatory factor (Ser/Thr protein kinase)
VPSELQALAAVRSFVQQVAVALNVDAVSVADVILAVDELVTNVIVHGYHGQPGQIQVEVACRRSDLIILIRDTARHFDPTTAPEPDLSLPLHRRPLGGMGVHLARNLMDAMTYRMTPAGENELTIVKRQVVRA